MYVQIKKVTLNYWHMILNVYTISNSIQVELENPDYARFPKLRDLRGFETVVGPGDILYIPNCWWHQVETLAENTVSITFWFKVRFIQISSLPYLSIEIVHTKLGWKSK